jgi:3-deoxy-D-manno-octulosonic acid kinase
MNQQTQLEYFQQNNTYCLFDQQEITDFSPDMLGAQFWREKNAITGSAQGRGTTWFVQHNEKKNAPEKHWVLRHYYRGGLIGKIINDSYFFTSQKNTRAAREFALLALMQKLALPAPKPIAYRITRHGLFYRADLLSSRIENAQDLVATLTQESISDDLWFAIGKTIKVFHKQGIYHHDLNAHNILVDNNNKLWLIDFDQGEQRKNQQGWQQSNMQRLLRSFHKEQNKLTTFNWQERNWQTLLDGYVQ